MRSAWNGRFAAGLFFLTGSLSAIFGAEGFRDESDLFGRIAAIAPVDPTEEKMDGFEAFGGRWTPNEDGTLTVDAGPG